MSKYPPQNLVLKNPQSIYLPQSGRPSFAPIHHNQQNYTFYILIFRFFDMRRKYTIIIITTTTITITTTITATTTTIISYHRFPFPLHASSWTNGVPHHSDWQTNWLTHSLAHSLTDWHTLNDWLNDLPTHSLTDWLTDSLTHSLTDSEANSLTVWLTDWTSEGCKLN